MSLIDELRLQIAEGLLDGTLTCCSRWASRRRIMGEPFPGPYSDKHHPWVRAMHDSDAEMNAAMKGAQLGVTEVAINRCFYTIDMLKRDVLYVLPNAQIASDFSKGRFATALKHSPYLADTFTDTNTVNLKQAGTVNLYIRGSRGESNLVSIPVSELILDEVDRMEQKAIWLALERLSGQKRKRVFALSTPTVPNYGIHKLYKDSTQEHFYFKCPRCSRYEELIWPDNIEIVGEYVHDPRCRESYLKCKQCGGRLDHEAKPEWLAGAIWQPTADNGNPDNRGFYVNQLYSYTVTPGEIAVAHFRGFGDESARQELYNSKLGLPYIGEGAQISDTTLEKCIAAGGHSVEDPRPLVGGERLVTMGVDQGNWNFVEVTEWFVEDWTADLNAGAVAKVLWAGKFHLNDWHLMDQFMQDWQVLACVIDADPNSLEARRFARKYPGFVWLCRYRDGKKGKEIAISEEDSDAPMATVDRTNWMDASLGRFHTGRLLLPRDITNEYLDHVKAPARRYTKGTDGNTYAEYVETGADHYAHARTYSEIALPFVAVRQTSQDIARFL